MLTVIIRTVIIYIFLVFAIKITGKRQVGELQFSELVITLLLSELASKPIVDTEISLLYAFVPILLLIVLEVGISFLVMKLPFVKTLFDSRPSVIIEKGRLNIKTMRKQRITIDELYCQLRMKNISGVEEVEYAIVEQNGSFSVFEKGCSISHLLIVDGKISRTNLERSGKTDSWLMKRLDELKLTKRDVFIFSLDDSGKEFILMNNRLQQK